jgi:hypothetical protein
MTENVGNIYKLRIGYDDSTTGNECWMVEKVIFTVSFLSILFHLM